MEVLILSTGRDSCLASANSNYMIIFSQKQIDQLLLLAPMRNSVLTSQCLIILKSVSVILEFYVVD